jgi:hypothetical protein
VESPDRKRGKGVLVEPGAGSLVHLRRVAHGDFYFQRFGFCDRLIVEPPSADFRMAVVVPAHDEPDLVGSLESLRCCRPPSGGTEVIVVVNSSETAEAELKARNARSAVVARDWFRAWKEPWFRLHVIECPDLPRKHAGVGLARKIGMDEAVRRFAGLGGDGSGIIVCYDADCRCDPNLLTEIEAWFSGNPRSPGCSVYFEHPLDGPDPLINEAISRYELHLRYYVEACRYARHPFAFHTIGSSMAVTADAYVRQGGMNRRQAGEDFYFLQKLIPLGGFGEVNGARVIPSPRVSTRVPFGTGRAVGDYCRDRSGCFSSYPLEAFEELRVYFERIEAPPGGLLEEFLKEQGWGGRLKEIASQTKGPEAFRKRFFRWFDAFMVMKWVHFARDHQYGAPPVEEVAGGLRCRLGGADSGDLLDWYRRRQRGLT